MQKKVSIFGTESESLVLNPNSDSWISGFFFKLDTGFCKVFSQELK